MALGKTISLLATAFLLLSAPGANAQLDADTPDECRIEVADRNQASWTRCADAATPGSMAAVIAHANLGSIAAQEYDFETALHHYDLTIVPGQDVIIDPVFHALRCQTYRRAGRNDEALRDAERVLWFIDSGYADLARSVPLNDQMRARLYELILGTLVELEAPQTGAALEAYLELPTDDWIGVLNRSTILLEIEQYDLALSLAQEAVHLQPNHPATQNSVCYILAVMDRGEDALPYCERAMGLAPNNANIIDSYAAALSSARRCDEAMQARQRTRELEPSNREFNESLACEPN